MNTPIILGVDPGTEGALAGLDAATGALIWIEDMPIIDKTVPGPLVVDLLTNEVIVAAHVEKVWASQGQGASSSFNFGCGTGTILGVLAAMRVPVFRPTVAKWKRAQGVTADKETSRLKAIELWPEHSELFRFKKHHGRAEAALIGRHGWQQHRQAAAA